MLTAKGKKAAFYSGVLAIVANLSMLFLVFIAVLVIETKQIIHFSHHLFLHRR